MTIGNPDGPDFGCVLYLDVDYMLSDNQELKPKKFEFKPESENILSMQRFELVP
jgi:hypothetical protein